MLIFNQKQQLQKLKEEYGFKISENIGKDYDAVVLAVVHDEFTSYSEEDFANMLKNDNKGIVIDIKGVYRNQIKKLTYWSL